MTSLLDKCIALYLCNDNLATPAVVDFMDNWPLKANYNTNTFSTVSGDPPYLDRCFEIDGEDEEIVSSALLGAYNYFKDENVGSLNVWIKPSDSSVCTIFAVGGDIAVEGGYFNIFMVATKLFVEIHNGTSLILSVSSEVGSVPLNVWSMLSFCVNGTGNALYRNAQLLTGLQYGNGSAATRAFLGDVPSPSTVTSIGSFCTLDGQGEVYSAWLEGKVDALGIFNEKLVQAELTRLYDNGNGRETLQRCLTALACGNQKRMGLTAVRDTGKLTLTGIGTKETS